MNAPDLQEEIRRCDDAAAAMGVVLMVEVTARVQPMLIPLAGNRPRVWARGATWWEMRISEAGGPTMMTGRSMEVTCRDDDEVFANIRRLRRVYESGRGLAAFTPGRFYDGRTLLRMLALADRPWRGYSPGWAA